MSSPAVRWLAAVALLVACAGPAAAQTDWLFAPFIGGTFGGSTALIDLDQGTGSTKLILGGTAGLWSAGILGVEGDFAYAPRFFQSGGNGGLVSSSNVMTLGVNLVVTTPLSLSRESLRPYLVGGLGWMHTSIEESQNVIPELVGSARNSLAMNVGGGAVGFITPRTGIRFELRQFRSLERQSDPFTLERMSLLSFWRATVGVVISR